MIETHQLIIHQLIITDNQAINIKYIDGYIYIDGHTSTDNPSTDNSTYENLNSFSRSMNLGEASQSHRSLTNQESPINDQEASSPRSNLPPQ